MKLKQVSQWCLPPALEGYLRNLSYGLPRWDADHSWVTALKKFRNKHRDEKCFIIASGPSLASQDLTPLTREVCMSVSFSFLHPAMKLIKPKYHVLAPNHKPFSFELPEKYLTKLNEITDYDMDVFYGTDGYPFSAYRFLQASGFRSRHCIHLVDYSGSPSLDDHNAHNAALWDVTKRPFRMRTVIYGALQLALYMGFSRIYLLGVDHDYLKDMGRAANHFYEEKQGNPADANHLAEFTSERWFHEYYVRWRDYRLIHAHAKAQSVEIYNATAGGMLDVFPRIDLEHALQPGLR